jgi:hypothetical protein
MDAQRRARRHPEDLQMTGPAPRLVRRPNSLCLPPLAPQVSLRVWYAETDPEG